MGNVWQQPSPSDWDRWHEAIRDGSNPSDAAKLLGFNGSSTFKRNDPVRHQEILDEWRHDRDEGDCQYVRDRLRENVERAMQAEPVVDREGNQTGDWTYQGNVANRSLELLGKQAGMFGDGKQQVEITGPESGPVQIEDRSASLADVARVLEAVGALAELSRGTPHSDVPAAHRVLPAPPDR